MSLDAPTAETLPTGPQSSRKPSWPPVVNPVWRRELLQASRLTRTPYVLMTTTIVLTVITCTVGGVASASLEPSELGSVLYHVFFSLCFAVIAWVGPGVGTSVITSEHTNHTWEALRLASLSARQLARGKFLAAATYLVTYLVMLAPIGAVPFVAGGVTAAEVILAFVALAVFAILAVGFGVAVGSSLQRAAPAMLVSILTSVSVSLACFFGLGVGGSLLASQAWPSVVGGAPVWLPPAWCRAPADWTYLTTLVFGPLTLAVSLGSFFYQVTVTNLSDAGDNRLEGLKRWTLWCFVPLTAVMMIPRVWVTTKHQYWLCYAGAMAGAGLLAGVLLLVMTADPFEPSRRLQRRLAQSDAGILARVLAPNLPRTCTGLLLLCCTTLAILFAGGSAEELALARALGTTSAPARILGLGCVALTITGCLVFQSGLVIALRSRSQATLRPRITSLVTGIILTTGPWLALGIAGLVNGKLVPHLWLAMPSPLYSLVLFERLLNGNGEYLVELVLWCTSVGSYIGVGTLLWVLGVRRVKRQRGGAAA